MKHITGGRVVRNTRMESKGPGRREASAHAFLPPAVPLKLSYLTVNEEEAAAIKKERARGQKVGA